MFAVAQKKGVIPMNTKISYLYRDADNYKMHNKCVIAGTLTTEQARTIKDSCEMGEYFIPRQVGLPEHRFDRYDPAVDHCWFELDEDCFSETVEPPMIRCPVRCARKRMWSASPSKTTTPSS